MKLLNLQNVITFYSIKKTKEIVIVIRIKVKNYFQKINVMIILQVLMIKRHRLKKNKFKFKINKQIK